MKHKKVDIEMTLTSPNCPVAESLPNMVKENILKVDGVKGMLILNWFGILLGQKTRCLKPLNWN